MWSPTRRAAPLLMMYRMTRQEPFQPTSLPVRAPDSRSPFVRLRELLGEAMETGEGRFELALALRIATAAG